MTISRCHWPISADSRMNEPQSAEPMPKRLKFQQNFPASAAEPSPLWLYLSRASAAPPLLQECFPPRMLPCAFCRASLVGIVGALKSGVEADSMCSERCGGVCIPNAQEQVKHARECGRVGYASGVESPMEQRRCTTEMACKLSGRRTVVTRGAAATGWESFGLNE